ncbi:2'-5' RNA ligase family protein [Pinibacter soli]|uniref:A-kinase anchor protein 7-like phosphoesterase domain-containing protein n=1 Tax=Pinibacter soli TaxID=3044211 RepID=A0ABT6RF16_9BACT|nr:2'-5' RNA ligase family protein [Pinibacter soli]MDI3321061.1 hypothetical protein [Pinibacter soli]
MDLKKHYENLWYKALSKFKQNAFEYDHLIDSNSDKRFGISLIARPSEEVKQKVQHMFEELRKLEPDQYFYPSSEIHITVLSIISAYDGFSLKNINTEDYIKVVESGLHNRKAFDVHFHGITASPSCIILQGFPQNDELHTIRCRLRELFNDAGLQESIDKRYSIITAHSTVVRFRKKIADNHALINKLKTFRGMDFGKCRISELELVCNDWYQRKEKSKLLHTFHLPE